MTLEVAVRNVTKSPITIRYRLPESEPEVTDARGRKVVVAMPPFFDFIVVPTERVLTAGETVTLFRRKIAVANSDEKADPSAVVADPTIRVPAGKYKIGFSEFVQDKVLLSTGTVEVEVTGKPPLTAWGQEVNGLPAGLGFRSGTPRSYRGETVALVVRVRNVGKEGVARFRYCRETYFETPPVVMDGKGEADPARTRRACDRVCGPRAG